MAALEERFSSWADLNDYDKKQRSSPAASLEEGEADEEACGGCVGAPAAAAAVDDEEALRHRSGPNTGPKGVLADHRAHQRAVYARAARAKAHREAVLRRIACGAEAEDDDDDDDDAAADDDLFLQRYCQKRLQEMITAAAASADPPSAPHPASFGALEAAQSGPELLRLLEQTHAAGAPAVVHVHAPHSAPCRAINAHLAALARGHAGTRFLHVPGAALAASTFDASTLPLLITYDAQGQVADSLPCVDVALGKGGVVQREDVEWWLEGAGVL